MSASGGERAPSRAPWMSVLGLLVLFGAWGAFAVLAVPLTRSMWAAVSSDFASSLSIALQSSAMWVLLLAALLLLVASARSERGRTAAGAVGLAIGVLGLAGILAASDAGIARAMQGASTLETAAAAAATLGGALLVATPVLRRQRSIPQHLPTHRHRAIHGARALHRYVPPRHP